MYRTALGLLARERELAYAERPGAKLALSPRSGDVQHSIGQSYIRVVAPNYLRGSGPPLSRTLTAAPIIGTSWGDPYLVWELFL